MVCFDDVNLQRLLGHEAAEDESPDRFREYFFKNKAFDSIAADLPIKILVGHKGMGKSALLRMSHLEATDNNTISLFLQPNDVLGAIQEQPDNFLVLIEQWRQELQSLIFRKAIEFATKSRIYNDDLISEAMVNLPNVLRKFFSDNINTTVDEAAKLYVSNYLSTNTLRVYLDDLDRGWKSDRKSITLISALLNAIRDIVNDNRGIQFRIALRSDVYYLVRTSDESTDKIENYVTWLSWNNHEILALMAKRIETYFGNKVDEKVLSYSKPEEIAKILSRIMEERFRGAGKWSNAPTYRVLASMIRRRPRDLVKFCHAAGKEAHRDGSGRITTKHFKEVFDRYSQERLQDIVNEFKTELPGIESLLLNMKPEKRRRRTAEAYQFKNDELITKIKNVMDNTSLHFTNGRQVTSRELAQFMYKIDFITARKALEGGKIDRKYFDQSRYLQNQFVEFGYDWEIHPAYRWALQPDDISSIFESLDLAA